MLSRLTSWIKRLRGQPEPAADEPEVPYAHLGESHSAHAGDNDPDDLHRGRRRIKETFTNHWDLDYLPRDEVERILEEKNKR